MVSGLWGAQHMPAGKIPTRSPWEERKGAAIVRPLWPRGRRMHAGLNRGGGGLNNCWVGRVCCGGRADVQAAAGGVWAGAHVGGRGWQGMAGPGVPLHRALPQHFHPKCSCRACLVPAAGVGSVSPGEISLLGGGPAGVARPCGGWWAPLGLGPTVVAASAGALHVSRRIE